MEDTVANRIRLRRVNLELTQEYVAEKLGYKSTQGYGDIERGKSSISIDKLQEIADLFNCHVIDLIPNKALVKSVVSEPEVLYGKEKACSDIQELKQQVKILMDLLRPKIKLD